MSGSGEKITGGIARLARRLLGRWRRAAARPGESARLPPSALLDASFLRQLESLALAARGAPTGGMIGEHASKRKASSVEFSDYRSYVPGDDFRLIDWNVYARLGELCLKLTQARENVVLHLLLDASASMEWGEPSKFLVARRVAAALGVVALASYDTVVLTVLRDGGAQRFPLLRGRASISRLVGYLSDLQASGATDLRASAAAFGNSRSRGGVGIVISDLWVDAGWEDALRYLVRGGLQPTLIHVLDQQELEPQVEGALELVDSESGKPLSVVATPALLARYRAALAERRAALNTFCRGLGIAYLPVQTSDSVETLVLQDLRQLAVVR